MPPIAAVKRPKRTASKLPPMANIVDGREVEDEFVAPNDGIRRFLQVAEHTHIHKHFPLYLHIQATTSYHSEGGKVFLK